MFDFYCVGGAVRDQFLNQSVKDIDFTVTAPTHQFKTASSAYLALEKYLIENSFRIYVLSPEYLTIRARAPANFFPQFPSRDFDFVLARKDGPYLDGRRPAYVQPGSLFQDLQRRDFTVNAMALSSNSNLSDPFLGRRDLKNRVLRFVGDPETRIREDGLRVIRGLRFQITKGLIPTQETDEILRSSLASEMLQKVSIERIQNELNKMIQYQLDSIMTLNFLVNKYSNLQSAIFRDSLKLQFTLKS